MMGIIPYIFSIHDPDHTLYFLHMYMIRIIIPPPKYIKYGGSYEYPDSYSKFSPKSPAREGGASCSTICTR